MAALQCEKGCKDEPRTGALVKANQVVRDFQENPKFAITLKCIDVGTGGLRRVGRSSLGHAMGDGTCLSLGLAMKEIGAQGGLLILRGDQSLVSGRLGRFSLLRGKNRELGRAVRSSYAAEVAADGEGVDVAQGFHDPIR